MKIFIVTILILGIPFFGQAALQSGGKNPPLQSFPEATNPTINNNVNTPGNAYNATQDQIQQQAPGEDAEQPENPVENVPVAAANESNANLFVILILICSLGLVGMLGWVYYRYRIKKD